VSTTFITPRLQRTLSAVYRFYDGFLYPTDPFVPPIGSVDDRTPPISSQLNVSIPQLRWTASRAETDFTYRFSALTLTQAAPSGTNLVVQVTAPGGDYVSFEPIVLKKLPVTISSSPARSDFLNAVPLWPTTAVRPALGETAVRGVLQTSTPQPVADLKVEMWLGPAIAPPGVSPFYTRTNANGEFLYCFPLLKGVAGSAVPVQIRLNDGTITIVPSSLSIVLGRTQILHFQRT
jgi:hypothetical protein